VDTGATITADGEGFEGGSGPGTPTGGSSYFDGASYGGNGGDWGGDGTNAPTYGSITAPVDLGSGAGDPGGGAAILTVTGNTDIEGTVTADGAPSAEGRGAGAGGSVFLTTGTISGAGDIRTNGGAANGWGAGGGGRVAAILTGESANFSEYTGTMTAFGDNDGLKSGAAGTVYRETAANGAGHGELIVDNADAAQCRYADAGVREPRRLLRAHDPEQRKPGGGCRRHAGLLHSDH
jgi:hypothetical protein